MADRSRTPTGTGSGSFGCDGWLAGLEPEPTEAPPDGPEQDADNHRIADCWVWHPKTERSRTPTRTGRRLFDVAVGSVR